MATARGTMILMLVLGPVLGLAAPAWAATFNLSGTWTFVSTNGQGEGVCPAPADQSGTAKITQTGDDFTLVLSGIVCEPAAVCTFSGTVAGAAYTGTNSVVVDKEGGVVNSTLTFTARSSSAVSGSYHATYTLNEFSCQWSYDFSLSRSAPALDAGTARHDSGSVPTGDAGTSADAGESKKSGGGCAVARGLDGGFALAGLLLVALFALRRRPR